MSWYSLNMYSCIGKMILIALNSWALLGRDHLAFDSRPLSTLIPVPAIQPSKKITWLRNKNVLIAK